MHKKGCRNVIIRIVDTDVVVLAVSAFCKIAPDEMWVAFGVKPSFRYIAIHEMVSEESMFLLKRFVALMYDRTSESMEVNDARNSSSHRSLEL